MFVQCSFLRGSSLALANLYANGTISIQPGIKHGRLQMFPNASLLLWDLQREDAGKYTCAQYDTVNNSHILYQKTLVLLTVEPFPAFPVKEGKNVKLKCLLVCDENEEQCPETPSLTWRDDSGKSIRNQAKRYLINAQHSFSTTLDITVMHSDHNRHWTCDCSVNNKVQVLQEYTLTIKGAGDAVYLSLRQSVLLPCHGKPGPRSQGIQWTFERESNHISVLAVLYPNGTIINNVSSRDRKRIEMFPNASLWLQDLQKKDAGIYTCGELNTFYNLGEVSLILLTVELTPHGPAVESRETTLKCSVLCGKNGEQCLSNIEDVELTWYNDTGDALPGRKGSSGEPGIKVKTKVVVQKSDHQRKWTCSLSVHNQIRVSQEYMMTVQGSQVQELFVPEGSSVEFPGIDPSDLRDNSRLEWSFQEITASEYRKVAVSLESGPEHCSKSDPSPHLHLLPNTSLLLQDAQAKDAGYYQCFKYNGDNKLIQIFTLAVLSVAADSSGPVQEGSNLTLNCSVASHLPISRVSFRWTDAKGNLMKQEETRLISQLTITDVRHSDSEGLWRCSLEVKGTVKAQQEYRLQVADSEQPANNQGADSWLLKYIIAPVVAGLAGLLILMVAIVCLKKRRKGKTATVGERSHAGNKAGQPDTVPMQNQDSELEQVDSDLDDIQYITITHQLNRQEIWTKIINQGLTEDHWQTQGSELWTSYVTWLQDWPSQ